MRRRRTRIACDELAALRRWKAEAREVLIQWEAVWEAAGRPGRLAESKTLAMLREVNRLRFENTAWRDGVADVVEPFGFDREAACGPADLLPGLRSLVDDVRLVLLVAGEGSTWNELEDDAIARLSRLVESIAPASDEGGA